jgi:hypothetical protein
MQAPVGLLFYGRGIIIPGEARVNRDGQKTAVASGSVAWATAIVNGTRFYLPLVVKQALATPLER